VQGSSSTRAAQKGAGLKDVISSLVTQPVGDARGVAEAVIVSFSFFKRRGLRGLTKPAFRFTNADGEVFIGRKKAGRRRGLECILHHVPKEAQIFVMVRAFTRKTSRVGAMPGVAGSAGFLSRGPGARAGRRLPNSRAG